MTRARAPARARARARAPALTLPHPHPTQAAYEKRMAAMPAKKEGLEGLIEWAKGIYVFGLFSKNAEKPPWYLNPLITFPAIFVVVGALFHP